MSAIGNYATNVAAAISGHEGFSSNHPDAPVLFRKSMTAAMIYVGFIIIFSIGAARLSYIYNVNLGTSTGMTIVYSGLSFLFSSLYYPYYAFVLDPLSKKGGRR